MASNNQFHRRRIKQPKISISDRDYKSLTRLARRVNTFMTGNASFPTPNPTLIAVVAASDDVEALIPPKGLRNSAAQNADLYAKCLVLKDLLQQLQYQVWNLVVDQSNYEELYLSSGYRFQNVYSRTAKQLQKVRNYRQYNTTATPYTAQVIKWRKSGGLIRGKVVKGYNVYNYNFTTKTRGALIVTTTKTSGGFGMALPSGTWLEIAPYNTNGEGRSQFVRVS